MSELLKFSDIVGIEETDVADNESFQIDSYEKAEWAMEKAGQAESVIHQIEAERDRLIQKIQDAAEEKTKALRSTVEKMAYMLDPWAHEQVEKIGKKTIPLAMGEIKIVAGRESVVIDWEDHDDLVTHLKNTFPELVRTRTTEDADKTAIKKALKEGKEIDGVRIVRSPDRMEIKPREITA